jgi:putative peptide maturation dehydrogenase
LTGRAIPLDPADVELLSQVSSDEWRLLETIAGCNASVTSRLLDLAQRGILLADPPSSSWSRLAEQEAEIDGAWWHDLASVYHSHACWRASDAPAPLPGTQRYEESLDAMVSERGAPPTHFPRRSCGTQRVELEIPDSSDDWLQILRARRTTRAFRADRSLPLRSLEYVLHTVFGVQGIRPVTEGIAAIRRTSPSAGAMHPIDAVALVVDVERLSPGLYHYEADAHCLATLETMSRAQAREVALKFVADQEYFASAHVLIIQVARFDRNFWKYPKDSKAYTTVFLDAGHLSQTLYLAATRQGLGAFFTSAINDGDICDRLDLKPSREGVIGINGVGIPDPNDESLHFKTKPFVIERSTPASAQHDPAV